ncbi:MAG: FAD-linked oxidase C-terminal domain-containing protein, partial [bacterium]|nr:FAD-linked oxidase C-terminal domain-containing protein [bacterium]
FHEALAVMANSVRPGIPLLAAEVIDATGMDLVCAVANTSWPTARRHALVLLLEVVDGGDGSGLVGLDDFDVAAGLDAGEQARLWEFRERQSEAFSSLGIIHKLDVSLPLPVLAACAEELRTVVAGFPEVTTFGVFGHVADGNLHVEIHGPSPEDQSSDIAVLECVAKYGGSISAEHGVGRAKAAHLSLCRSHEEIAAMRALKSAWDPDGLMNPGVIFVE